MSPILSRYILKETAQTWLVVTLVLLLVLLTNQFAQVVGDAAAAKLPKNAVLAVMGFSSVTYLTILIPLSMFLSVMLAMARFYRDSEMAAIMASGIGPLGLYRPLITFALVLAAIVGYLSIDLVPWATQRVHIISEEAKQRADLGLLEAGRFVSFGTEQAVIYAESVSDSGRLTNVFVQRRRGETVELILAKQAAQQNDGDAGVRILTFYNGRRYEGVPGSYEFRVIKFEEHGIPYVMPSVTPSGLAVEFQTTRELFAANDPAAAAELQWRISVPIVLLVLTVLAVPLSRSAPREGRYSRVTVGILVYIIYANLLGAAKVWVEQGVVPQAIGMWWVHGLFLLGAVGLLLHQYGIFSNLRLASQARLLP